MNRGQLAFLVLVNAMVSLVIALAVVWAFEARRPDPEELAAINTPRPDPVLALPAPQPTPTLDLAATTPAPAVATETPTPESAAPPAEEVVYVVQPGDTMLVIATRYGVTVEDILAANNLNDPNFVFAGQRLVIPVQGLVEGVVPDESTSGDEPTPTVISTVAVAPQDVRIAAITGVGDLPNEQVILTNDSDTPYSLQGWQLQRGDGVAYTFRSDVPLFPGGSIRLHSGAGTDTSIDLYWGQSEAVWQAGAEVRLVSAAGDTLNTFLVP
jgi:LysM repeat protein